MLPILRLPQLAAVMLALAVPSAAVAQDAAFTAAEAQVRQEVARAGAPGVALAVVRADRVIYAQGFGVASGETRAPVTPDTLFQIGSATKMLTALQMNVWALARVGG